MKFQKPLLKHKTLDFIFHFIINLLMIFVAVLVFFDLVIVLYIIVVTFSLVYIKTLNLFDKFTYIKKEHVKGIKNYTIYSTPVGAVSILDNTNKLHNEKDFAFVSTKTYIKEYRIEGILISDNSNANIFTKRQVAEHSRNEFIEFIKGYKIKQKLQGFK